jgi:HlyD family secretion protein
MAACTSGRGRPPLVAYGTIEARTIDLSSQTGGRVLEVLADEGDRVGQGQPLVRIDLRELQAAQAQAQGALAAAKAREDLLAAGSRSQDIQAGRQLLAAAEDRLRSAQLELTRAQREVSARAVPTKVLDDARTAEEVAEAEHAARHADLNRLLEGARSQELREAAATREQAEAALQSAEIRLADVFAPTAGTLLHRMVEPGEVVRAAAPLLVLGEIEKPYIDVYVPEREVAQARVGAAAEVNVDALPGRTFSGRVSRVSSEAEFTPKNVETADQRARLVFRIRVDVENQDRQLLPGMPGHVIFKASSPVSPPTARRPTTR